ncbi:hypothetical protein JGF03_29585 [Salmonella enterica subsp. enterica serovar Anatum]|nr:hypothetical protein [Salmonella enterica subsp. enterica serovar Anatum]
MEENKTLKEYLRKFLEGYKYVVENRYNYQFSSNPEAFPFMRKDDYKISIFYLNQSFFERQRMSLAYRTKKRLVKRHSMVRN